MKKRQFYRLVSSVAAVLVLCSPLVSLQATTHGVLGTSTPYTHPLGPFTDPVPRLTASHATPNQQTLDLQAHWLPLGPHPVLEASNNGTRPDSGRVASLAIAESKNGETVYAGSAGGGVWASDNGGAAWHPLTDQQVSLAIGSIAVDPHQANVLYAGTGEQHFSADSRYGQGILKSTDGGKTWTLLGSDTFSGVHIGKIAVDPFNSSNVWVAADNGLWQSTDAGHTWTQWFSGLYDIWPWGHLECPTDVYLDAKTPGVIYLSVMGGGLYKSTDGGQNFDLLGGFQTDDSGLPNYLNDVTAPGYHMFNASLAVVEGGSKQPDTLYTAYADHNGELLGLYTSKDGGSTWTHLTQTPPYFDVQYSYTGTYDPTQATGQGWYDNVLAVDPTHPQHILAGGITLIESWDGGQTWKTLDIFQLQSLDSIDIHPDQHAIVFDSAGHAFLGNDGGVFEEMNNGTWQNVNANLNTITFYPGLSSVQGGQLVVAGAQDNGTSLFSGQKSWQQILGGDGGYTYVDPNHNNVIFAESQFGTIVRSTDGGQTWNQAMPNYMNPDYLNRSEEQATLYAPFVTPFVVQPLKTGAHEVLVGADFLYRSSDDGATYLPISPYLGTISAVAQSQTNPNVLYVGTTYGQVFASFTGGGTQYADWQWITPFMSDPNAELSQYPDWNAQVSAIAINPQNDSEITVTYGNAGYFSPTNSNHVFWTANTHSSLPVWRNVSQNLPLTFVQSAVYVGHALAVGTEQGVYMTRSGSSNWAKLSSDLPNVPVTSLVAVGHGKLIAGTYGRGVYSLELGADATKIVAGN